MSRYAIAHLEQIEELTDGREPYRAVRHHLGISTFGVTAWTGHAEGDRILNEHDEMDGDDEGEEELYLVLAGRARFELDGESVDAPAGTFVFVPPQTKRTAYAEEPETTIVAVGGASGKPYEARGWELWAPLFPLYQQGEHTEVVKRLRPIVEAHPRYALLFFNLACCESMTGEKEQALEHLRRALELSDEFRAYAREDSDLDPIREETAFDEIVGRE